ncbi:MAG: DUF835 domain-containing protein [Euryarchaeota archaeon]|nr:DUF835 domain-containing protein [Euryarchaeota archaeon]
MSPPSTPPLASSSALASALVGRSQELERLRAALVRGRRGQGSAWLVVGPGGMGKTRVLRSLEDEARREGFQVLWGNGLKEAVGPFFAFQQVFRRSHVEEREADATSRPRGLPPPPWPSCLLFEEERPLRFREALRELPPSSRLLLVSRENPSGAAERSRALPEGAASVWITRLEGEGRISPGNLDALGEVIVRHFRTRPGSLVALEGLEYLTSQNGFPPVLRLLQFLRDVAQEQGGHLLVAVRPSTFDRREISLLESDSEVVRSTPSPSSSDPAGDSPLAPGASEPPAQTLLRYLGLLQAFSQRAPVLLVVDDLHWIDALSGLALQFLCRNARDLPVVIVGGAREEELPSSSEEEGTSVRERVEALEGEGLLQRLPLHPFEEPEAYELASQVLGAPIVREGAELSSLLRRTKGNPYFLRETLLQIRSEGGFESTPEGFAWARGTVSSGPIDRVPTSLQRLTHRRLTQLAPELRSFLDVAAVAGSEFPLEPVASVRGISLEEARKIVHDLEVRERLLEPSTAVGSPEAGWTFAHPLVWEVVRSEIPSERLRPQALSLLDWWEAHRPEEVETLARLAHDAQDLVRGAAWVRRAFDLSTARLAPEAAGVYLGWLHELLRSSGRRPAPAEVQEEAQRARRLAKAGGARAAFRFLEGLSAPGDLDPESWWEVEYSKARALDQYGAGEVRPVVERLVQEMEAGERPPPSPRLANGILMLRGFLLFTRSRWAEALKFLEQVANAPRAEVDHEVLFRALTDIVYSEVQLGRPDRAREVLEEADRVAAGDGEALAQARHARGMVTAHTGDPRLAARYAEEASELFSRAGMMSAAAIDEYNAAAILLALGELDRAEPAGLHLYDVGRKFALPRISCSGSFIMARVELRRDHTEEALRWAEISLKDALRTERPDDVRDCRGLRAEILGRSGDLPGALKEFEAMDREGLFEGALQATNALKTYSELLEKHGDRERALEVARRVLSAAESLGNAEGVQEAKKRVDDLSAAAPSS